MRWLRLRAGNFPSSVKPQNRKIKYQHYFKMNNLSIEVVKESFKMLTMLENKKFSSVVKLARTLHCEPTKLVAFILDNPKLFHTSNRWEHKKKVEGARMDIQ